MRVQENFFLNIEQSKSDKIRETTKSLKKQMHYNHMKEGYDVLFDKII